ncbi:Ribosome LSU-associated GTP-binding protein HflX [Bathymodiolus thermophilus thioautotrophic gill symbiont]|uniref:GTPase HflX n=3 Tax=sulfur-oxidizing symbionts TaxID=32036 RepID=A0A1H6K1C0_9GAMM|nr:MULTISPECIES: ribosome rescue GTPase HflX [Gammaproteobacteria]CAC9576827.1 Ribosome LSU-associated GTP-binding protein HflX [uncultured Gammaproteobacteria bacterium]CAB5505341.1 Ribosome LSU-associated GTP-binding protein HflX [Bathymodiolus azoricus thioautotrophic gill symbiont]CAB5507663.1 Ribosome LSU-associated GTP-binding protein HflX [Bathymodiolus thermophilus thioautotrophic gill symbiont]CAC9985287.1 Ribosome LSU-associated GTP-binding protein HflX [uncultured Gammaproteobacteria
MELFDRQKNAVGQGERTLLVYIELPTNRHIQNGSDEFDELAKSSGLNVVQNLKISRNNVNAKYFIGSGKVEEIVELVKDTNLDLVIFSSELSPSQERNLEKQLECQVMDRTGLILDIFSLRARSFEGKLQVELAQLRHLSTRLVRGWTHLERQKGGIGLRGPGETQLETDKRLIAIRIKNISKRLEKVHKQRDLGRKARLKNELPMIALAGYTNAGKSTLFNTLTQAEVFADDQLFATLDATIRRVILPASGEAVIADTVGFIQDLPHDLVAAFKSTLEETRRANVLLHIVDAADEYNLEKIEQVQDIIFDIEANKVPSILVMNKIDCLTDFKPRFDRDKEGRIFRVWISAQSGDGIDFLYQALAEQLSGMMTHAKIQLDVTSAYIRSEIHNIGYIHNEKVNDFGQWVLEINVTHHYLSKLLSLKGVTLLWEQKSQQK